jgi:hypothetical protein
VRGRVAGVGLDVLIRENRVVAQLVEDVGRVAVVVVGELARVVVGLGEQGDRVLMAALNNDAKQENGKAN